MNAARQHPELAVLYSSASRRSSTRTCFGIGESSAALLYSCARSHVEQNDGGQFEDTFADGNGINTIYTYLHNICGHIVGPAL